MTLTPGGPWPEREDAAITGAAFPGLGCPDSATPGTSGGGASLSGGEESEATVLAGRAPPALGAMRPGLSTSRGATSPWRPWAHRWPLLSLPLRTAVFLCLSFSFCEDSGQAGLEPGLDCIC